MGESYINPAKREIARSAYGTVPLHDLGGIYFGTGDEFGDSLAISGDAVVVGASFEGSNATGVNGDQGDVGSGFDSGAAYVFDLDFADGCLGEGMPTLNGSPSATVQFGITCLSLTQLCIDLTKTRIVTVVAGP